MEKGVGGGGIPRFVEIAGVGLRPTGGDPDILSAWQAESGGF